MAYLRGLFDRQSPHAAGHNPVGALVVVLFFCLLLTQATTGMFANDEIVFEGPLADMVSRDMSDNLTSWHHYIAQALLWLVGLHIVANISYWLVLKHNLILPMFTGKASFQGAAALFWRSSGVALVVLSAVALVVGLTIGFR